MSGPQTPAIFDGHNDALFKLFSDDAFPDIQSFLDGRDDHVDVPRCLEGGFGGGMFAVYAPSPIDIDAAFAEMAEPEYDLGLPEPLEWSEAAAVALAQTAALFRLEALGALKVCRSVREIEDCLENGPMAAVLHMEGAEAIDADFNALDVLYRAGLRSLGPVWSRPNIFGHGVPFRYPGDGDTGPGLTELGVELVRRCDALGILIDLSHMTEAGFWDVARHSDRPLVATHSNVHAISPHARNLTDRQLAAIRERDGIVGINFAVAFLREDGRMVDTGLDMILRHMDHLIDRLGEDRVGFGSDFDGAQVPVALGSAAGLPVLRQAMLDHGFGAELMKKLCHGNWLRVLAQIWAEGD